MFELNNVSMIYDLYSEEKTYALKSVSYKFPKKGLIGIIGPSGSGKSTLMYLMSTLKKPIDGSIKYCEKEITKLSYKERESLRRNEFGFIFQKHYLVPYMSAIDNVTVASTSSLKDAESKAKELLSDLGLKDKDMNKIPSKLSGGQCQRVAIARSLINSPKVVFADEPTASLDHENAFNAMNILRKYSEDRLIIVVTHDRSILSGADKIIEMWDGAISGPDAGVSL